MKNAVLAGKIGFPGLVCCFALLLLLTAETVFAKETYLNNKITVSYLANAANSSSRPHGTRHGYVEYRFRIQNDDTSKHTVALTVPNSANSGMQGILTRATNAVEVGPGDSVVLSVLQPPLPIAYQKYVAVTIDGGRQEQKLLSYASLENHCRDINSSEQVAHLLVSKDIPSDMRDYFESGSAGSSSSSNNSSSSGGGGMMMMSPNDALDIWRSELECTDWSTNWLAYSRFDGIAVTSNELRTMSPEIFQAVRRYTEAGGMLIIVGQNWTHPKEWPAVKKGNTRRGTIPNSEQFDAILGMAVNIPGETENAKTAIDAIRTTLFTDAARWASAMESAHAYYNYSYGNYNTGALGGSSTLIERLPVITAFGVPVKPIMVLILLFAIVIGPVNIYVLTMMKRRIWLLWTVPATSLLASFIVLGVNFFQEGFVKNQSSGTVTILDQRRGEAITFGYVGFYATLTPSNGIVFENSTEATHSFERNSTSRNFEIQNNGGVQRFSRGWINARLPSYFAIRKVQPRLERLDFQWTGDQPSVLNGLGVDIENLLVCGPDGKHYEIRGKCLAGQKHTLTPNTSATTVTNYDLADFQEQIRMSDYATIDNWYSAGRSSPSLAPGTFRATVAGDIPNPFIEAGIEGMRPYRNSTTIYGIF